MRMGLYNSKLKVFPNTGLCVPRKGIVGRTTYTFDVAFGILDRHGISQKEQNTMMLTIDYQKQEQTHRAGLLGAGFGSHLGRDFAEVALTVAKQYLAEQGCVITEEVNHWPILQILFEDR